MVFGFMAFTAPARLHVVCRAPLQGSTLGVILGLRQVNKRVLGVWRV